MSNLVEQLGNTDSIMALRIVPGTVVVFGDLKLHEDEATDSEMFENLVNVIGNAIGHDQWVALRLPNGGKIGAITRDEILAAFRDETTTQEGTTNDQPLNSADRDAPHA